MGILAATPGKRQDHLARGPLLPNFSGRGLVTPHPLSWGKCILPERLMFEDVGPANSLRVQPCLVPQDICYLHVVFAIPKFAQLS